MRTIPKKNYFILLLMVVATIAASFVLAHIYNNRRVSLFESALSTFLPEIKDAVINSYVEHNPTVVLYISDKRDSSLEGFEEEFKEFLIEHNIQQYFAYLDISAESGNDLIEFKNTYGVELDFNNLPILIVMYNGELLSVFNQEIINISKISLFLRNTGVIEEEG